MKMLKNIKNKRYRKRKKEKIKSLKQVATGVVAGSTIGVTAGVLFAPKSGKETRADIANEAKELSDKSKLFIDDTKNIAREKLKEVECKN